MTAPHAAPIATLARWENPDDELLPLTRCLCGAAYEPWEMTISIYPKNATVMPCCGRRLYFRQRIEVLAVQP